MLWEMERKRRSRDSWVRPRWDLEPSIVCDWKGISYAAHSRILHVACLSRTCDSERSKQSISAFSAMGCQDTLNEWDNACAMEDIELLCILLEDFREAKLLNCAATIVVRWIEYNMCWRTAFGLINCKEATRGAIGKCWIETIWSWWTKAQKDLEECRIRLWGGFHHLSHC